MEENNGKDKIIKGLSDLGKSAKNAIDATKKAAAEAGIDRETVLDAAAKTFVLTKKAAGAARRTYADSRELVIEKLDQNGDGTLDAVDLIMLGLKMPGVRVDRARFLRKELFKNHPQAVIDTAVAKNPAAAGIPREEIDKLADEVINFERTCVTGISTALGMPGGVAMVATSAADITQYYGYTLRAAQKLLYLYGFPEIDPAADDLYLDTETINALTLCLGVMYGAAGANTALKAMARALATGVEKQLLKKAITKGALYKLSSGIAKWFGVKMTKGMFAGFFKNAIPVVGGVIGGGITFFSFKPCCSRLKSVLMDTLLSNPDHVPDEEEICLAEDIAGGDEF